MPIIRPLVKGIGAGIGLTSEAIADHKAKKAARERSVSPHPTTQPGASASATSTSRAFDSGFPTDDKKTPAGKEGLAAEYEHDDDSSSLSSSDLNNDQADWALDEAAEELGRPPPAYHEASATAPISDSDVAKSFLERHKFAPTSTQIYQPLPSPVILPQRRPKDKSRGFIRGYAPLLDSCSGIDQKTFIDFLDDLDRASKASPVFDVINLACFAAGMVPNPIAMGVTIAVQVASRTAQEVQSRYRRNTYLDQVNETLFKPRGLFCMIMTFKPDSPHDPVLGVDVTSVRSTDQALLKVTSTPDSELRQKLSKIRLSSGVSKGEISLPEAAPLVYPAIDAAAQTAIDNTGEASDTATKALSGAQKNKLSGSLGFVTSYLDRRAQATYTGTHPDSKLVMPPPEKSFASRFSDPNHPANSGSLSALLTGGHVDLSAKKRARKAQRRANRRGYQLGEQDLKNAEMGRLPRRKKGLVRRVLQKDVLYLTIVNLPSESEMKEIMQELERMK